jgi:hypothetical protein
MMETMITNVSEVDMTIRKLIKEISELEHLLKENIKLDFKDPQQKVF